MDNFELFLEKAEAKIDDKKEVLDFLKNRREGARKIYNETSSKGGPAQLTAWHFKAKDRQYLDAISAVKNNRPESYFKNQVNSLISKIRAGKNKQKNFQELMGELEVWGEIYAELFGE